MVAFDWMALRVLSGERFCAERNKAADTSTSKRARLLNWVLTGFLRYKFD